MAELSHDCCPPDAQTTCCEPAEKANCCAIENSSCGCAAGQADYTGGVREAVRAAAAVGAASGAGTGGGALTGPGARDRHDMRASPAPKSL
jgi:hypothetical protein